MAHDAEDEDTSSTATPEEFLPNFTFNTELTNKIANLDERVTDLEQSTETDSAKVTEFMSHYYASDTAEAYAFLTDPHLMGSAGAFDEDTFNKYINVLSKTVKQTSAAYVVCGGDWLNQEDSKAEAAAKLGYVDGTMRSIFPGKYYPIAGNHDFNYIGYEDGARLPDSQWVSNTAMRNFWFHDHEQCYYKFKVMTAQNYVLNTRTDHNGTYSYDKTMLDWFAANLIEDDAPHSTIMFHIYFLSAVGTTIPTRVVAIGKIIAAFNAHSTCVLTNDSDGYDKAYDFTNTTGHIDYVIVGHTHADFSDTFGGVPVVGCDNFTEGNVATFDMVFADYTNHKLYLTRFGSGESREFYI
jgi:predicted phosphodiesterase